MLVYIIYISNNSRIEYTESKLMLEFESHFSASTTPIVETLGFLCFNLVYF